MITIDTQWNDYIAINAESLRGKRYRIVVDCELDSDPSEIRIYEDNDDEPAQRIVL